MNIPPPPADPELMNIIDKLAQFVARNGPNFEQMTKEKQNGNPKFAFLFGGEHYDYYQYKIAAEKSCMVQPQQNRTPAPTSIGDSLWRPGFHLPHGIPPNFGSHHPFPPFHLPPPHTSQPPPFMPQQQQLFDSQMPIGPPPFIHGSQQQFPAGLPFVSNVGQQPYIPNSQPFGFQNRPPPNFQHTSIPNPQFFANQERFSHDSDPHQQAPLLPHPPQHVNSCPTAHLHSHPPPLPPPAHLPPNLSLTSRPPPPPLPIPPPLPSEPIVPNLKYYELPAGLMVPLVKPEDSDYSPLDPADLRLPPPQPPSEKLLQAVKAFYAPPSHDCPRDIDGWEKLGLYEFFREKTRAKKEREEREKEEDECFSKDQDDRRRRSVSP